MGFLDGLLGKGKPKKDEVELKYDPKDTSFDPPPYDLLQKPEEYQSKGVLPKYLGKEMAGSYVGISRLAKEYQTASQTSLQRCAEIHLEELELFKKMKVATNDPSLPNDQRYQSLRKAALDSVNEAMLYSQLKKFAVQVAPMMEDMSKGSNDRQKLELKSGASKAREIVKSIESGNYETTNKKLDELVKSRILDVNYLSSLK